MPLFRAAWSAFPLVEQGVYTIIAWQICQAIIVLII